MFSFQPYHKLFQNSELQSQFEENGYVIVPFYNQAEVESLIKLYRDLHPKDEVGFFPSTFSKDHNYRDNADKEVQRIGLRSMSTLLQDFKVICGSYIVKSPGPDSIMNLHQDMTLVDESKFAGINIWCPLTDLNDKNGALFVLEGSQRLIPSYRASSIPEIYAELQTEIKRYMKPLYLKAGEAVIFDQSIFHYSPPNISNNIRIVTNTFFTYKDAILRTAWYDKTSHVNQVELFEQSDDFVIKFEQFGSDIYARPKIGKSLGLFDYDFPKVSLAMLENKYGPLDSLSAVEPTRKNGKIKSVLKRLFG